MWFGYRGRVTVPVTSPAHCQSQSDLKHRHGGDLQLECALLNLNPAPTPPPRIRSCAFGPHAPSRATGRAGQPSPRRLGPHRPRAGADGHPGHVPCRPPAAVSTLPAWAPISESRSRLPVGPPPIRLVAPPNLQPKAGRCPSPTPGRVSGQLSARMRLSKVRVLCRGWSVKPRAWPWSIDDD